MQRVAIGRALVREPNLYLMDEPLSSLDAKLRESLRIELKGTRVKITEICPGRTKTDFGKNAFKNLKMAKK